MLPGAALEGAVSLADIIAAQPAMAARMVKREIEAAARSGDWAVSAYDKDQQALAWLSEEFRIAIADFDKSRAAC